MKTKPTITLSNSTHNKLDIVMVSFEYDTKLISSIKSLGGAKWSQSLKCWYFLKKEFDLNTFFEALKAVSYIDYSALNKKIVSDKSTQKPPIVIKEKVVLPSSYIDLLDQKRYSRSTIKTYCNYFGKFIRHFEGRDLDSIGGEEINDYILYLIRNNKISASEQNQRINSIKFYYEKVLGKEKHYYDITRPKSIKTLPNVLSPDEIKLMIDTTKNLKHKCIISILYSAGLRRNELLNLKLTDISSGNMQIKICNSKGNKDRYVGLSSHLLRLLRKYFVEYKPALWLIEGQAGNKYSPESILKVVKTSAKRAGIRRNITPHMLRHSFATHHLESGTDLRYIQEFLGHNSSKTTEIYTHVAKTDISKFKNPLDELYNNEE